MSSMEAVRVDADELEQLAPIWDAAVDRTPGADPFCASTVWTFAAAHSFPEADPPVAVTDGVSAVGLRATTTEGGYRVLVGLDPIWGFATPVVGHPVRGAQLLAARLRLEDHQVAVVTGQHAESPMTAGLVHVLDQSHRLAKGPVEQRLRADLSDGVDAWFARRSSRFRQRLRRIERDADAAGIVVEDVSALPPDEAMDRVLAIEARSWKARDRTGLVAPTLAAFYRRVAWRLAVAEQLRLLVARQDDRDVGFVLGGVRDRTYRGLQLTYTEDVADLGVGHLLQLHQVRALEGTGIDTYDLGMDMAYKRRWADRVEETFAVVIT